MRWKKNGFSYLIWFVYLLAVTLGLFCFGNVACGVLEIPAYWGIAAGILWLSFAGLTVYGLHVLGETKKRTACFDAAERETGDNHRSVLLAEVSLAVILLAVGLILRVSGLDNAGQGAVYFEKASVIPGQSIPETAHGAVWLYMQLLHTIFYFLGNKMVLAVFCQIVLQLIALLLLYLTVRRCAGKIGGMVFLGLCVFSDYLRGEALTLSPGMLYLVIWAAVLLWTVTEDREEIHLCELFLTGLFLGIVCYLDIAGVILLPLALGAAWCRREKEIQTAKKAGAVALCVLGLLAGFGILIGANALFSGKQLGAVLQVWFERYVTEGFRIPVVLGEARSPMEYLVVAGLMALGIFSFWRDRESDGLKGWVVALIVAALLGLFGCSTTELPPAPFLYLLTAILAGISVGEVFRSVRKTEIPSSEITSEKETKAGAVENRRTEEITAEEERSKAGAAESRRLKEITSEEERQSPLAPEGKEKEAGEIQFIENPLPLPKKHVSRRMDYKIQSGDSGDDYDLAVDENDDFDI